MVPSIYGENMFDDFFDNSFFGGHSPLFGKHERNLMKTDIHETDDAKAYRFAVELPGFQKDEIHVDVKDGYLTVSAQNMRTAFRMRAHPQLSHRLLSGVGNAIEFR